MLHAVLNHIYLIIVGAVLAVVIFSFLYRGAGIYAVIMSFIRKPETGRRGMVGRKARVISDLNPEGKVKIRGEIWAARSENGARIEAGADVAVVGVDGLVLVIKRLL